MEHVSFTDQGRMTPEERREYHHKVDSEVMRSLDWALEERAPWAIVRDLALLASGRYLAAKECDGRNVTYWGDVADALTEAVDTIKEAEGI